MAHANAIGGATIFIDENVAVPPEDTVFDPDGWPLPGIRLVGGGASVVVDIDADD